MAETPFRNAGIVAVAFGVIAVAIILFGQFCAQMDSQKAAESAATAPPLFAPFAAADNSATGGVIGAEDAPTDAHARGSKPDINPAKPNPSTEKTAQNKADILPEAQAPTPPAEAKSAASKTPSQSNLAGEAEPTSISPDDIQRVIGEQYRPVAKRCYEETRARFPDTQVDGRVVLSFDIIAENNEGRVELAEPGEDSTLFADGLHDCMLGGLGDVVFPVPDGEQKVRVKYPFNFSQAEAEEAED